MAGMVAAIALAACSRDGTVTREAPPQAARPIPSAEPADASPPAEPPAAARPAPAVTRSANGCTVTVGRLLDAQEYRGPGPMTPALSDSLARDPDMARSFNAKSHGDQHIQCTYRVEVNGAAYSHMHVVGNTLRDYDTGRCEQVREAVADSILSFTHDCADLHGGEYWGSTLEPLPE